MMQPSKLSQRVDSSVQDNYEPIKLTQQQQQTDLDRARIKRQLISVEKDYTDVSDELRSYEDVVTGVEESFIINPNVIIDKQKYLSKEKQLTKNLELIETQIDEKQADLIKKQKLLKKRGITLDLGSIDEYYESLKKYSGESQEERINILNEITAKQQEDLDKYDTLIKSAGLSKELSEKQEQLFMLASENVDLITKPYIYDKFKKQQELEEGKTALGFDYGEFEDIYKKKGTTEKKRENVYKENQKYIEFRDHTRRGTLLNQYSGFLDDAPGWIQERYEKYGAGYERFRGYGSQNIKISYKTKKVGEQDYEIVKGNKIIYSDSGKVSRIIKSGGSVGYFDNGKMTQIVGKTQEYYSIEDQSKKSKGSYTPYILKFDKEGKIKSEEVFGDYKYYSYDEQGDDDFRRLKKTYTKEKIVYVGGKPITEQEYDVMLTGKDRDSSRTIKDYGIYKKEDKTFKSGLIDTSKLFSGYKKSSEKTYKDVGSDYESSYASYMSEFKDFGKGLFTKKPTPYVPPPIKNYNYTNPKKNKVGRYITDPITGKKRYVIN